jgi:hypothetical protein
MISDLSFAGYPVEIRIVKDEVIIRCKQVIGTLSQVEDFMEGRSFKFGIRGTTTYISDDGVWAKIGCLRDTSENFNKLYKKIKAKCQKL